MNREHVKKEATRQKGGEHGRCDKVVRAVSGRLFKRLRQNFGPLNGDERSRTLDQTRDRCLLFGHVSHHAVR
jgi:hypothetical protein